MIPAHIEHVFKALDQRDPRAAATGPECNRAAPEGSSPTDGASAASAVSYSQLLRQRNEYQRLIDRLHELMREGRDIEAFDLVSDAYRAIHGVG